eukprot:1293847-Rhodomonas_salina.1
MRRRAAATSAVSAVEARERASKESEDCSVVVSPPSETTIGTAVPQLRAGVRMAQCTRLSASQAVLSHALPPTRTRTDASHPRSPSASTSTETPPLCWRLRGAQAWRASASKESARLSDACLPAPDTSTRACAAPPAATRHTTLESATQPVAPHCVPHVVAGAPSPATLQRGEKLADAKPAPASCSVAPPSTRTLADASDESDAASHDTAADALACCSPAVTATVRARQASADAGAGMQWRVVAERQAEAAHADPCSRAPTDASHAPRLEPHTVQRALALALVLVLGALLGARALRRGPSKDAASVRCPAPSPSNPAVTASPTPAPAPATASTDVSDTQSDRPARVAPRRTRREKCALEPKRAPASVKCPAPAGRRLEEAGRKALRAGLSMVREAASERARPDTDTTTRFPPPVHAAGARRVRAVLEVQGALPQSVPPTRAPAVHAPREGGAKRCREAPGPPGRLIADDDKGRWKERARESEAGAAPAVNATEAEATGRRAEGRERQLERESHSERALAEPPRRAAADTSRALAESEASEALACATRSQTALPLPPASTAASAPTSAVPSKEAISEAEPGRTPSETATPWDPLSPLGDAPARTELVEAQAVLLHALPPTRARQVHSTALEREETARWRVKAGAGRLGMATRLRAGGASSERTAEAVAVTCWEAAGEGAVAQEREDEELHRVAAHVVAPARADAERAAVERGELGASWRAREQGEEELEGRAAARRGGASKESAEESEARRAPTLRARGAEARRPRAGRAERAEAESQAEASQAEPPALSPALKGLWKPAPLTDAVALLPPSTRFAQRTPDSTCRSKLRAAEREAGAAGSVTVTGGWRREPAEARQAMVEALRQQLPSQSLPPTLAGTQLT